LGALKIGVTNCDTLKKHHQSGASKIAFRSCKKLELFPVGVIHNRILLEAKRLMLFEEISHKEIAYKLGFDSPASFSSFIKSKTGLSPIALVNQLAEIHK
jgi:AraC-like DNA-binding protein